MIHALFFLSGVSALIFQHIWFRQVGLVFGNTVWASSLVLSSFMAGLALGNGLATASPPPRKQALLWYSILETAVAISGVALVFLLPVLGEGLTPVLVRIVGNEPVLGATRLVVAFCLLVVPTAAMGMTLPILVGRNPSRELFGVTLGRLYGWNTLGAVVGALAGEALLYRWIGIRDTALVAGSLNLVAALLSFRLAKRESPAPSHPEEAEESAWSRGEIRFLIAAAIAGGCLLALEVVWTRFLQLFFFGTALTFAIMLALTLAGIAAGSLLASLSPRLCAAPPAVAILALLAALAVTGSYVSFPNALALDLGGLPGLPWSRVSLVSAALILPTAIVSGALFTSIGVAIARSRGATQATGLLTLSNTLGAMVGAVLAAFVLLPFLGIERSFWGIALAYILAALLAPGTLGLARRSPILLGVGVVSLLFTALFPVGLLQRTFIWSVVRSVVEPGADFRVTAFREGLAETLTYVDTTIEGETLYTRLVTNGFSMSGNQFVARRYMQAFVYLPVAIHPHVRRALLISYGVGPTARALTQTKEIEQIDVVDISPEIVDMARFAVAPGDPEPLADPRVAVHIEDGRFFLQTAALGYDLITSEPPPPHLGGVVNLYTREYFELIRRRLNDGGIVSYWLPVHQLTEADTRAITAAFCSAFPDCTLWKGMNLDWILIGTRGLKGPVSAERFRAQWASGGPADLEDIGFETPEQLGALFMAEGKNLPALMDKPPLEDNYPGRLTASPPSRIVIGPWQLNLMNVANARERFLESPFVRSAWPDDMRLATLPSFEWQGFYDEMVKGLALDLALPLPVKEAVIVLRETRLSALPAMMLGTTGDMRILANRLEVLGAAAPLWLDAHLAVRDLTARRYEEAVGRFRRVLRESPSFPGIRERLVLSLCLAGQPAEAARERSMLPTDLEAEWVEGLDEACGARAPVAARP